MNQEQESFGRIVLLYGLLGSALTAYLCLIGMVETFSDRYLVGSLFTLGDVLLVSGAVVAGILASRELRKGSMWRAIGGSIVAGLITCVFPLLIVVITILLVIQPALAGADFTLRIMFVNLSPQLVEIITFGQGLFPGGLIFAALSAAMGAIGAAFVLPRQRIRRSLINSIGIVLIVGIFSENVGFVIRQILGPGVLVIVLQQKALTVGAAVVLGVGTFLLSYFLIFQRARKRWDDIPPQNQKRANNFVLFFAIVGLFALPWLVGVFLSQALFMIGLYVMLGLGLNIVVGYAGLLDLGYVAFFAIGAYTMGILTSTSDLGISNIGFWLALPVCILMGVLWGLLLGFPVLRMRGDYLAIVTLGFGEIIRILFTSDWLAPIQGGPQGVLHIPNPMIFGYRLNSPQTMYYLVVLGSLLVAFVTLRLRDSKLGRQWMAMREDEDVAEAMGVNLISTKLLAFAIGAAFSALAGGIFASRLGNIFPHSLNLLWSINALAVIIVGGLGSIPGVIVGALVLVGLPEVLREFAEYRLLIYGFLLIVMMLVRPEGLIPEPTRKRELHSPGQDVYDVPVHSLEGTD